jgi:hypothetical protein
MTPADLNKHVLPKRLKKYHINSTLSVPLAMIQHFIQQADDESSLSFSHDPASGAVTIDFERLETSEAVLPQFRLDLTTEHVAAWAGHVLRERWGRRSREITGRHDGRRFAMALRLTGADSNLVFYTHNGEGVIVLRRGRVLKVPFRLDESMGQFERRLGETGRDEALLAAAEFAEYVAALMF